MPARTSPRPKGPRPQSGNRGWVDKLATGENEGVEKIKIAKEEVTIGTWNAQTLRSTGKLELPRRDMQSYKCDILGQAEVRWTGSGEMNGGRSSDQARKRTRKGSRLSKRARKTLIS